MQNVHEKQRFSCDVCEKKCGQIFYDIWKAEVLMENKF